MAESKYKEIIPHVLETDIILSTNQVRERLKEHENVNYIDFNLVSRLLNELNDEGRVEKLKGPKRAEYWRLNTSDTTS